MTALFVRVSNLELAICHLDSWFAMDVVVDVEKGNDVVPIDMLKEAWKEYGLDEHVNLSISGCLGPCSMKNVVLMMDVNERIWLGNLGTDVHYSALVTWAQSIAKGGTIGDLPDEINNHQFKPKISNQIFQVRV